MSRVIPFFEVKCEVTPGSPFDSEAGRRGLKVCEERRRY